ncbi:MAG: stage V sporulation protein AE [Bacillota bacterium]
MITIAKKAILITDGDQTAAQAVECVGKNLGLRTISASAGTPTACKSQELVELIKDAESEVALVMFDDQGNQHKGLGEEALEGVLASDEIEILGVVAVASHTKEVVGIQPDFSISQEGEVVTQPVDKDGSPEDKQHLYLEGDTVDVINQFEVPLIVGVGDIGKMNQQDGVKHGCPVTTKAVQEILTRSGADGAE